MFKFRRQNLIQSIANNAVIVIATNQEQIRNNDVNYPFRVGSNFYYFTGFCEPNTVMILSKEDYIIFMQKNDSVAEMWQGKRLGLINGSKKLNAKTQNIANIVNDLPKILQKYHKVYFDFDNIASNLVKILTINNYASIKEHIAKLRVIKDNIEIENIKQACNISDKAHIKVMKNIKNMEFEYQVQSIFNEFFTFNNTTHAYPPIVASGENALILHYTENNKKLDKNDLILIDAGCEYKNYASDITRTFPISGKFSNTQKEIYHIVLTAQLAAIKVIKIGKSLEKPHKIATKIIKLGLEKLGVLPINSTDKEVKHFFPHGTSHFMGLDVHDVGEYKINNKYRLLEEGMIITVEPGIYIGIDDKIAKKSAIKYRGIGIRIEDDILITKQGASVLTNAPKTIEEIEKIML